jgi:hypothetical protein
MEVPALGPAAAKLRAGLREQPHAGPAAPVEAVTAFLVYVTADGRYVLETSLDAQVTASRPPTRDEVIGACQKVADDMRRQAQSEEITVNVLGNISRMLSDPGFHALVTRARTEAEAAAAIASGARVKP